jgi:hypothetical protein
MTPIVWTYLSYVVISILLTVWVARTLHRNGRVFLVDAFGGNETLADSVNHLLVVGFYLVNIGYIALALKEAQTPGDFRGILEILSTKLGLVSIVLGLMHFTNLFIFSKMRKRGLKPSVPPPTPMPPLLRPTT